MRSKNATPDVPDLRILQRLGSGAINHRPAYEAECLRSRDLGPEPGGLIFAEKVFELIFVRDEVSYFLVE